MSNNNPYSTEAVEASAKAAINNAGQVVDLAMSKSIELLERNVKAAKATIERQASYTSALREARGVEDFARIQEEFGKQEVQALESFAQEIYRLSGEAASNLAEVTDNNRSVAEELVSDSLEQFAQSIPNGGSQPYGSFVRDAVRTQINMLKTFSNLVEKSVAAQRESFNTVAEAVSEAANVKAPAKQPAKRK